MESRQTICHDYIAISNLADTYDVRTREVSLRQRHNIPYIREVSKERSNSTQQGEEVELFMLNRKLIKELKERFKSFPQPLAWVNPGSKKRTSPQSIIEEADKKYAKLYHLCNPEVHGNYSVMSRLAVLHPDTPRRHIPFTAWGEGTFFQDIKELEFDFLVTEILIRITELAPRFLLPEDSLTERAKTLSDSGNDVLEKLRGR